MESRIYDRNKSLCNYGRTWGRKDLAGGKKEQKKATNQKPLTTNLPEAPAWVEKLQLARKSGKPEHQAARVQLWRGADGKVYGKLNPLLNHLFYNSTTKLLVMGLERLLVNRASSQENWMDGGGQKVRSSWNPLAPLHLSSLPCKHSDLQRVTAQICLANIKRIPFVPYSNLETQREGDAAEPFSSNQVNTATTSHSLFSLSFHPPDTPLPILLFRSFCIILLQACPL